MSVYDKSRKGLVAQLGDHLISRAVRRSSDLVARYGGEEFVVLLPKTDANGAQQVAKKMQQTIQQLKIVHAGSSVNDYVTLSIGIFSMIPSQGWSSEWLIKFADEALYEAKHLGRNRIIIKNDQDCVFSIEYGKGHRLV